ncbi:MAG: acyltransferase [Aestuariivirga sp.]
METTNRVTYLDGIRGLAITLVVLFHAFSRWPAIYPYGSTYADFPLFLYGDSGVYLFFMLSGFVILMTLRKCKTFGEFIWRRWLRLFPAMLFCSLLIFLTARFLPERPAGTPHFVDLLPGLSFLPNKIWTIIMHRPVEQLEGSFWTLNKELIFYVVFGVGYFTLGETRALAALVVAGVIGSLAFLLPGGPVAVAAFPFTYGMFSWFAIGCVIYRISTSPQGRGSVIIWAALGISAAVAPLSIAYDNTIFSHYLADYVEIAIFTAAVFWSPMQRLLSTRYLVFFGFVSYPFYLLHENAMVALIVKIGAWMPGLPGWCLPIAPVALLIAIAYGVAKWVEPELRKLLAKPYTRPSNVEVTP